MNKRRNGILLAFFLSALWIVAQWTPAHASEDRKIREAAVVISPSAYDFGEVRVGSVSTQLFTIANASEREVAIGTVMTTEEGLGQCEEKDCPQVDPQSFIVRADECSGHTLAPGEICTLEVAFSPVAGGLKTAHLFVPLPSSDSMKQQVLLKGNAPYVIDSEKSEVVVSLVPNQPVDIRCKTEPGEKIWVLVNLPLIDPNFWFVRPSDGYCLKMGYCISLFSAYDVLSAEAENLFYTDSCNGNRLSLGVNDFTGLGEVVLLIRKGDSPSHLETIQKIRILVADPLSSDQSDEAQ